MNALASSGASFALAWAPSSSRLRAASLRAATAPAWRAPFAFISPQPTACASTGSSVAPSGAAAARGPSAMSASPPCSRNSPSAARCSGVKPGGSSAMTPTKPWRSDARSGTAGIGRRATSSRSAARACSTIGAPPVAVASSAESAITATAGAAAAATTSASSSWAMASVPSRRATRPSGASAVRVSVTSPPLPRGSCCAREDFVNETQRDLARGRRGAVPASDGHAHAQGRAVRREDPAIRPVAAKLGERDPERDRRVAAELRGVRFSVGEIAEDDDALVDLQGAARRARAPWRWRRRGRCCGRSDRWHRAHPGGAQIAGGGERDARRGAGEHDGDRVPLAGRADELASAPEGAFETSAAGGAESGAHAHRVIDHDCHGHRRAPFAAQRQPRTADQRRRSEERERDDGGRAERKQRAVLEARTAACARRRGGDQMRRRERPLLGATPA